MSKETDIKIQSNVEVPGGKHGNAKYPWLKMEPGDCLFLPGGDSEDTTRMMNAFRGWLERNRPDCKGVGRTMEDGSRVWMVRRED